MYSDVLLCEIIFVSYHFQNLRGRDNETTVYFCSLQFENGFPLHTNEVGESFKILWTTTETR